MIDLDSKLGDVKAAYDAPEPTGMTMNDPGARLRLSHSTLELLHSCERKLQKIKLLHNPYAKEDTPATVFGKAYGAAAQLYMILRTMGETSAVALESAIWEAFIKYTPFLEDEQRFLERLIFCLEAAVPFHEQKLMEWEIATFNGKFAAELSFCLNINEKYYYVGYLDLVLRNRRTKRYAVTDYKTTAMRGEDLTPNYKYSDQVIGYSIILDAIAGEQLADFDTNYWVNQISGSSKTSLYEPKFHSYTFPKTLRDRFEWFTKIYLDVNYLQTLEPLEAYPRRASCKAFNRVCQFFNDCQFTSSDLPAAYVEDTTDYQFTYELDDLFQDHQRRLNILMTTAGV
ncbi:exonuclease [Pseudomonas phage 119X]|uniref:exonuclease n=1 Tax=Pseudomonas phage 119X TaxID=2911431 RepID=UPI00015294CE|nr:exonuclease [Pseudomonas phage 119X]